VVINVDIFLVRMTCFCNNCHKVRYTQNHKIGRPNNINIFVSN